MPTEEAGKALAKTHRYTHDPPQGADMDILDHLTQEHRKAEQLLAQLAETSEGPERDRLVTELSTALEVHMEMEEEHLYPLVTDILGTEPESEAEAEHGLARTGLGQLTTMEGEPGFGAALDMVKAGIAHHVEEEEHEVFPKLREHAAGELSRLDPEALEPPIRGRVEAASMSKDELYRRAQEANIPGRSGMTKRQLAEAVAQAW